MKYSFYEHCNKNSNVGSMNTPRNGLAIIIILAIKTLTIFPLAIQVTFQSKDNEAVAVYHINRIYSPDRNTNCIDIEIRELIGYAPMDIQPLKAYLWLFEVFRRVQNYRN